MAKRELHRKDGSPIVMPGQKDKPGDYKGNRGKWSRSPGGLALPPLPETAKNERVRPTRREERQCDFAITVELMFFGRKNPKPGESATYAVPVPVEMCDQNAVASFYENGKTNHRCSKHCKRGLRGELVKRERD